MKTSTLTMRAIIHVGDCDDDSDIGRDDPSGLSGIIMMTPLMTVMFTGAILVEVLGRRQDLQADLLWQSQQWRAAGTNTNT